jgi:hypothetical protein
LQDDAAVSLFRSLELSDAEVLSEVASPRESGISLFKNLQQAALASIDQAVDDAARQRSDKNQSVDAIAKEFIFGEFSVTQLEQERRSEEPKPVSASSQHLQAVFARWALLAASDDRKKQR